MKIIYLRTNLVNGKKYIGQTKDLKRRERDWRKLKTNYSNKELNEDRIKYGLDNFKIEVLETCENEEGDKKERYYIEKYNTLSPNGYNMYSGGIKGYNFNMSDEAKEKISKATKGIAKSEETKKKISDGLKNHPLKSKQVYQYTLDGKLVAIYPSAKQAARDTGFSQGNISACIVGGFYYKGKWKNRIQSNGYIWRDSPL